MIQRIQTIYLLVVSLLGVFGCFMPLIEFTHGLDFGTLNAIGFMQTSPGSKDIILDNLWGLMLLSAIIPLIAFVTIWLYHKRMLQIRLTILNILLMIGYYAVLGVGIWSITAKYNPEDFHPQIAIIFPLINIILSWLAIRGIGKDEAKVRAADRLR